MAEDTGHGHEGRAIGARQTGRIVVVTLLVVAVVAFAVDNSQDVQVGWLFGDASFPLWIVIVGTFLVGGVAGYVAGRRHG